MYANYRRLWARDADVPGDLDHSRATLVGAKFYGLQRRCPDMVCSWLVEGLPRWREERPEWFTREWWDKLPAAFREGLVFAPAALDLSA